MAALYNRIGKGYDTTRKADPEIARRLSHHLLCRPGDEILDVGCGTGNYTIALSQLGMSLTGVDVSEEMLAKAKEKSVAANPTEAPRVPEKKSDDANEAPVDKARTDTIDWIHADAGALPFADATFDAALCVLAIHHFDSLKAPFREVYRTIRGGGKEATGMRGPGPGRFVLFTSSPEQMRSYWLNEYFPRAMEASIRQMPSTEAVLDSLRAAGFTIVGAESFLVSPTLSDFFLYSGKFDPRMYLDEKVRSGISTFASLADDEEIRQGCQRLQRDIEIGRITEIANRYSSTQGDYMFIVAQKGGIV